MSQLSKGKQLVGRAWLAHAPEKCVIEVTGLSDPATLGNSCHLPSQASQAIAMKLSLKHVKDEI